MSGSGVRGTVTMHDVAAAAGVSVKTVSNVVNDYPHIRPATREKVQKAIDDLGYRMNLSARSLRQGRTGHIEARPKTVRPAQHGVPGLDKRCLELCPGAPGRLG